MAEYFSPSTAAIGYRGRPRTTLPSVLDTDLQLVGLQLKTSADLDRLCDLTVNGPYLLDNLMIKLRLPVVLYVSFAVDS